MGWTTVVLTGTGAVAGISILALFGPVGAVALAAGAAVGAAAGAAAEEQKVSVYIAVLSLSQAVKYQTS